ncbi:MAG: putative motility protein [Clostridia bacterium]|nr:putative motility protein [Clostridia bacterium]
MMDVASAAMSMAAEQLAVSYTMSMAKKAMDTTEMAAQGMLNMLPATPPPATVAKGQYIDVYA